jgi:excisionase family DNA binding protein
MARQSAEIMSIEQLAKYLDISRSTLYKLAQDGKLPGQKVGRRWRFHKDAIDEWLKAKPLIPKSFDEN